MSTPAPPPCCQRCGSPRPLQARGLCVPCYRRYRLEYPKVRAWQAWTAKERDHLRARYLTEPAEALAAHLGRTVAQVRDAAIRWGLTRKYPRVTPAQAREIVRLHGRGWTDLRIARRVGVSQPTVSRRLRRLGLAPNGGGCGRPHTPATRKSLRRTARAQHRQRRRDGAGFPGRARRQRAEATAEAIRLGWPQVTHTADARILCRLHEAGPATVRQLAAALGFGVNYAYHCLVRLEGAALTTRSGRWRSVWSLAAGLVPHAWKARLLLAEGERLAHKTVQKYGPGAIGFDEALGVAEEALLRASLAFDPRRAHNGDDGWLAFAAQRIRWALLAANRTRARQSTVSLDATLGEGALSDIIDEGSRIC